MYNFKVLHTATVLCKTNGTRKSTQETKMEETMYEMYNNYEAIEQHKEMHDILECRCITLGSIKGHILPDHSSINFEFTVTD